MKEPVFIRLSTPIYSVKLFVIIGATGEQVQGYFKTKKVRLTETDIEGIKELAHPDQNEGFAMQLEERGRFLIWLSRYDNTPKRIQALIHEITHTTIRIFDHIGADIEGSNHEPLCYLHDYITGEW